MASKIVETTTYDYLTAQWAGRSPILTENLQGQGPQDGAAFLVLQFPVSSETRLSVGTRRYREEGGLRIGIMAERGAGMGLIQDWGDILRGIFRDVTVNGVHYLVPSAPFSDDSSDQGTQWGAWMVVPFWRTFQG